MHLDDLGEDGERESAAGAVYRPRRAMPSPRGAYTGHLGKAEGYPVEWPKCLLGLAPRLWLETGTGGLQLLGSNASNHFDIQRFHTLPCPWGTT